MSGTVYLISGANRGIGLAMASRILEKHDNAFVYAGARTPDAASALKELKERYSGRVAVVQCTSADFESNTALAKEIETRHGRVDTVIANAGISLNNELPVSETPLSTMEDHFRINVYGHIVLFQTMFHLLKKSTTPRFITITSEAGSLVGGVIPLPNFGHVAYGSSKAALSWVTRKIHFENEWLVAFPLSPGPVKTDMLLASAEKDRSGLLDMVLQGVALTPDDVAVSLIDIIDNSSREVHGGEFCRVNGEKYTW